MTDQGGPRMQIWCAHAGKIIRLRQKLTDAADSVKGLFGGKKQTESQVAKLESVQVSAHCACSPGAQHNVSRLALLCLSEFGHPLLDL